MDIFFDRELMDIESGVVFCDEKCRVSGERTYGQ
jgi:hypothetical protein